MKRDVFISYSAKDSDVAKAICLKLERQQIQCWIAERDIKAGETWSGSIIEAIGNCQVMVLVFSNHSNLSQQVLREVERAVAKNVTIVPFRIDRTPMSKDLEYFLSTCQWLDGFAGPDAKDLDRLLEGLTRILKAPTKKTTAPTNTATNVLAENATPNSHSRDSSETPTKKGQGLFKPIAAIAALAIVIVLLFVVQPWTWFGDKDIQQPDPIRKSEQTKKDQNKEPDQGLQLSELPESIKGDEAKKWIELVLAEYRSMKFLQAELIGDPESNQNGNLTTIRVRVTTKVDSSQWQAIRSALKKVLDAVARGHQRRGVSFTTQDPKSKEYYRLGEVDTGTRSQLFGADGNYRYWVMLSTARNENNPDRYTTSWQAYEIEPSMREAFDTIHAMSYRLRVQAVNPGGNVVAEKTQVLGGTRPFHCLDILSKSNWLIVAFHMGPAFWMDGYYTAKLPPVDFSLDIETVDLKPGYEIVAKIEEAGSKGD